MQIRLVTNTDIQKWKNLSSEYDCYIKELASDLMEWYKGNDASPAFDSYIEAKIRKGEAFMAVDSLDDCLGVIAFSKNNNRITFFGISHMADFQLAGTALLHHALNFLDKTRSIFISEIASSSAWVKQHGELYLSCGFILSSSSLENGVPVNTFEKLPSV